MRKPGKLPFDCNRKLVVLVPVPGVKYYYHKNLKVYVDIEMFQTKVVNKSVEYGLNLLKKHVLLYVKKHKIL
jgi:hypothetical protein